MPWLVSMKHCLNPHVPALLNRFCQDFLTVSAHLPPHFQVSTLMVIRFERINSDLTGLLIVPELPSGRAEGRVAIAGQSDGVSLQRHFLPAEFVIWERGEKLAGQRQIYREKVPHKTVLESRLTGHLSCFYLLQVNIFCW